MTHLHRLRGLLLALVVAVLASVWAGGTAQAGTLHIRDDAGVLSSADAGRLRAVVDAAPFDARLVFTAAYGDTESFSRYVGSLANQRNLIAVGVDPEHRRVQVHFGPGTGVARSAWPDIERAGNAYFARRDWEGGAAAIFEAATRAVGASQGDDGQAVPVSARPRSKVAPLLLVLLIAGAVGAVVFLARRRNGFGGGAPYGSGYGPGYGPGGQGPGYGAGPYGSPGYPPGYPPGGGGVGPFGAGAIGAGLGGLAGYELGRLEGEREQRALEREDRWGGGAPEPSEPVHEEGGGGSSWGDDGGSGGGFDDSGGGGGFDGGGGGDGGGGSDF
ncbi:MAG: hypothetical protein JOZ69_01015 [Myxococcales bacterium]|nr:hypothetical protein [Myxococcales bacterium]